MLQTRQSKCATAEHIKDAGCPFALLSHSTLYKSSYHIGLLTLCEYITVYTFLPLPLLRYSCFWRSVQLNNACCTDVARLPNAHANSIVLFHQNSHSMQHIRKGSINITATLVPLFCVDMILLHWEGRCTFWTLFVDTHPLRMQNKTPTDAPAATLHACTLPT